MSMSRALSAILLSVLMTACASLPDNSNRIASYAVPNTGDTTLARDFAEDRLAHPQQDGFLLLGDGLDAFTARAVLAERAERSLDVQYYLYHDDMVGRLFTIFLWRAAERGVRVRLLLDDMDLDGRDQGVLVLDAHPNIDIRIFNPFDRSFSRLPQFVSGLGSLTRRMHNKSFTADNVATILGGRNIGNEYFNADPDVAFADLDVIAVGKVVNDVSNAFDRYWNSAISYPARTVIKGDVDADEAQRRTEQMLAYIDEYRDSAYMQALRDSELAQRLRNDDLSYYWGQAELLIDDPAKITSSRDATELHLSTMLTPYFKGLRDELVIVSPYFVPGDEGVEFLSKLRESGIRIRILTNSLASNDVAAVHAGYAKYRKPLLRAGVEIYELNKALSREPKEGKNSVSGSSRASLHAKTFVLDREKVFIGSLNLDPRSFYENTEIGLIIEQEKIASAMAIELLEKIDQAAFRLELTDDNDLLWHGFENGQPVTFDNEPYSGFWRRFGVGFMKLLPIESQL